MEPRTYEISPEQAADQLGVSTATAKRWAKAGTLKALKTPGGWWRFSQADLDEFIASHLNQPAAEATA
jgi:excisionase family DNA binding protein